MKRILFYIQLPPPVHGVSAMNKLCYDAIRRCECLEYDLVEISYCTTIDELGKAGINKIFKTVTHIIRFAYKLVTFRPNYLYMSPMLWGTGFLRDAIFMSLVRISRIKPIYHLHGMGIAKGMKSGKKIGRLYRFCFKGANIIALSNALFKTEISDFGFKHNRYFILPNAIRDVNTIGLVKENFQDPLNIIFLSNLQASKGIFDFLNLANLCFKEQIPTEFNVIGPYRNKKSQIDIEDYFSNSEISNVKFHGPQYGEKKYALLKSADILVYPTYNDAFPLVILEAMMFGLAVISTHQGAIPEIISDNENGYLVNEGNVESLFIRVKTLSDNRDLLMQMKRASRILFENKYSESVFEQNLSGIINELV
jgi:glycosyltransferase involved in cell wall biosynthesis